MPTNLEDVEELIRTHSRRADDSVDYHERDYVEYNIACICARVCQSAYTDSSHAVNVYAFLKVENDQHQEQQQQQQQEQQEQPSYCLVGPGIHDGTQVTIVVKLAQCLQPYQYKITETVLYNKLDSNTSQDQSPLSRNASNAHNRRTTSANNARRSRPQHLEGTNNGEPRHGLENTNNGERPRGSEGANNGEPQHGVEDTTNSDLLQDSASTGSTDTDASQHGSGSNRDVTSLDISSLQSLAAMPRSQLVQTTSKFVLLSVLLALLASVGGAVLFFSPFNCADAITNICMQSVDNATSDMTDTELARVCLQAKAAQTNSKQTQELMHVILQANHFSWENVTDSVTSFKLICLFMICCVTYWFKDPKGKGVPMWVATSIASINSIVTSVAGSVVQPLEVGLVVAAMELIYSQGNDGDEAKNKSLVLKAWQVDQSACANANLSNDIKYSCEFTYTRPTLPTNA